MAARLGRLMKYERKGQLVELEFEGGRAQIQAVTPRIVNVFYSPEGKRFPSKAIEGDKTVAADVRVEERDDGLWILTEEVAVRVCHDFYVDFFDRTGAVVCADYRGERKPLERVSSSLLEKEGHAAMAGGHQCSVEIVKKLGASEHFYGLGTRGTMTMKCGIRTIRRLRWTASRRCIRAFPFSWR